MLFRRVKKGQSAERRERVVHLPYSDRRQAGRLLAERLAQNPPAHNTVVLSLVRGGVPVGFEVAKRLDLQLDIVIVRKIGVPWQPELAMGAMAGSVEILDEPLIRELRIRETDVERVISRERAELKRRADLYREGSPELPLQGRPAIIVDDGLATGNTMRVAVRHIRSLSAQPITIAVPVGSQSAVRELRKEADDLICLAVPEPFVAVGGYYKWFGEVGDAEVQTLLAAVRAAGTEMR